MDGSEGRRFADESSRNILEVPRYEYHERASIYTLIRGTAKHI